MAVQEIITYVLRALTTYDIELWVVGSAATAICYNLEVMSDVDIVIHHDKWPQVARYIGGGLQPVVNKYGGLRFTLLGQEFDVRPDALDRLIVRPSFVAAYQPYSKKLIRAPIHVPQGGIPL